ncbi:MAG: hypothetical protein WCJ26_05090 [bacterium]
MKTKHIAVIILLAILSGCVTIVKWKYGITEPKVQTPEKLTAFLHRHKYLESSVYVFNDSSSYLHGLRNTLFRKHLLSHMIFGSNGNLLQRDTAKCQWSGYEEIRMLNRDSLYQEVNGLELAGILNHIHPISPVSLPDSSLVPPDFTIIVTWAKFLGTYNERLFELSGAVKINTKSRIRLIWLNIDMQESWKLTKEQVIALR